MITHNVSDDAEHMAIAAREALTRPSDYAAWDERWYTTHGRVMDWAERGDDLVAESNYLTALAMLQGAVAHDETGASEARGDDVEDTTASHWAVGSLRELFVRVYDEAGAYTPAFKQAVEIAYSLSNYPILDESDYSERETEAWFAVFEDALDCATRDHPDAVADVQCIDAAMRADNFERMPEMGHPDDLSWDDVADAYRVYRNEHFEWLARRILPGFFGVLPGQEPIPGILATV